MASKAMTRCRSRCTGPSTLMVLAVLAFTWPLISPPVLRAQDAKAAHTVIIKQMHYEPAELHARVGERITWKNEDIFAHTVTADDGSFDSGLVAPGQSWSTTVTKNGRIGYHCRPHPNMAATLQVSSGAGSRGQEVAYAHEEGEATGSLKWEIPRSPHEFHPILVNFTAALLPLALLSDLIGRMFRQQSLHSAAWWMMLYESAITPLTVAAGWWWKHASGPELPEKLISVHQWLGTGFAVVCILLVLWRWRFHRLRVPPSAAYLVAASAAVIALVYQGSLGGAMLFGR